MTRETEASVVLSVRVSEELKQHIEKLYKGLPVKGRPSSIGAMVRRDLEYFYLGRERCYGAGS